MLYYIDKSSIIYVQGLLKYLIFNINSESAVKRFVLHFVISKLVGWKVKRKECLQIHTRLNLQYVNVVFTVLSSFFLPP